MEDTRQFIERRLKALIPEILGIVEVALPFKSGEVSEVRFKVVRKKILDGINNAKRDILGHLKEKDDGRKEI